MAEKPLISIVIPTFNAAPVIQACLESIRGQTYRSVEVVVVDQESGDGTRQMAAAAGAAVHTLPRPAFYTPPSKSRNVGASKSHGQIVYHLDADMTLSPSLLAEAVETFGRDSAIGALIVHEEDMTRGFWSECKALERRCYWGNDAIESARIVRREVFEKVGGYDERISTGEDFDIHRRYKAVATIGFCENVVRHNLGDLHLRKMLRKKFDYGRTASAYFTKHDQSGVSLLKEQFGCYLTHYELFLRKPTVGMGAIAMKMAEVSAGGLGALVSRVRG